MAVLQVNLRVDQGTTLVLSETYLTPVGVAVDLTGYDAHMQVRSTPGASDLELDCSTVGYDGGTGNGFIVLGNPNPTDGTVNVQVPAPIVASVAPGVYRYDLDLFSNAATPVVTRFLSGVLHVVAGVTVDEGEI